MVLLPGETQTPAENPGKTGTPTPQTAGAEFTFTVLSVDSNYNTTPTTASVIIGSSDSNAVLPSTKTLAAGTTTFMITLKTANQNQTVFVNEYDTDYGLTPTQASTSTVYLNPNTPVKLAAILPGQTYDPGTENGRYGTPSQRTAETAFTVTALAVDEYWNTVSTNTSVSVTTEDPYDQPISTLPLVNGKFGFNVTMVTKGDWKITASDINVIVTSYQTGAVHVNAGSGKKLVIMAPGQTLIEGSGLTGTPDVHEANSSWQFTVYLTDNYYNIATDTRPSVSIDTTDTQDIEPGDQQIGTAGSSVFAVKLRTSDIDVNGVVGDDSYIYAYASGFSTGTAGPLMINNSDCTNLTLENVSGGVFPNASKEISAGDIMTLMVKARDDYGNICRGSYDKYGSWVGGKCYAKGWDGYSGGTVTFTTDTDGDPTYTNYLPVLPSDYVFTTVDKGVHQFENSVSIYKVGTSRWVKAQDAAYSLIYGEATGITVLAGALGTFVVSPTADVTNVSAGASIQIIGTAADAYGNPKETPGLFVSIEISTGKNSGFPSLSASSATTNSDGTVGVDSKISFKVSTVKGDEAKVKIIYSTGIWGQSGNIITVGGIPYTYEIGRAHV